MRKTLPAAIVVIVMSAVLSLGLAAPAPGAFLFAPHVDSATGHSARLVWVSEPGAEAGTVTLTGDGTTSRVTAVAKPADDRRELLHVAALDGLRPGVQDSYEIACGPATATGAFRTAPEGEAPFHFVIYGDTRSLPERHRAVAEAIAKEKPEMVVHTGDLVANGDDWSQWKGQFFDPAEPFLRECAFWPVRGNHEETAALYRDLFVLPNSGLYYSFDWGNAHFVVLDIYQEGKARLAMLDWFKKDLARNKAEWTFVVYHEPSFNVGGHESLLGQGGLRAGDVQVRRGLRSGRAQPSLRALRAHRAAGQEAHHLHRQRRRRRAQLPRRAQPHPGRRHRRLRDPLLLLRDQWQPSEHGGQAPGRIRD